MPTHPKPYRMIRDVLDLAMMTGAPLVVRRRCNPHQLAVWMAVRFLLDTTERTAFGSRDIADEAGLKSYPRVAGWLDDLVKLKLLEVVGYEEIKGGKVNKNKPNSTTNDRPIYRIPWKAIFSDSLIEAEKHLAGTATKRGKGRPSEGHELQLPMDFPVIDGSRNPLPIGNGTPLPMDHGARDPLVTEPVIDGSRNPLPIGNGSVTDRSHMEGRKDGRGRKGGSGAPTARNLSEPPPSDPPAPPADDLFIAHLQWVRCGPLTTHPLTLWRKACQRPRPIEDEHLAALAIEHDAPTGGHGWFWVGQAILACAQPEDVYSVAKIRRTLARWRTEDSYGSDLPGRGTYDDHRPRNADADRGGRPASVRSAHGGGDSAAPGARRSAAGGRDAAAAHEHDDDVPEYLRRSSHSHNRPADAADDDAPAYLRS